MGKKFVYLFNEGNEKMKNLLGGKGANLSAMTKLGLPVPFGFTISTEACINYYATNQSISNDVINQVKKAVLVTEKRTGKMFGGNENPLLFSVRSGARVSMPGMMNTILNIGLNDVVAQKLAEKTNNTRFVYDSYRRLIMMFADVVKEYDRNLFENKLTEYKKSKGYTSDADLSGEDFVKITKEFKAIYKKLAKTDFPQDPFVQLFEAVGAVFRSWNSERAQVYRKLNDIPHTWGTAVNVQSMVFGNMGETSGTGVAFTRNPSTGENVLYGEYLMNAQGEDVVAGIRTPNPISHLKEQNEKLYNEFLSICKKLEHYFKDMQDMEFTIEDGKLYMLQTRSGKRTAQAALKIAIDLVNEKLITKKEALLKIDPKSLDALLHPTFKAQALSSAKEIASGLPASPGAATGVIALTPVQAEKYKESGKNVILVREETHPEDIAGMVASKGVLTATGGMTSHAAVVARGIGISCVAGCSTVHINDGQLSIGGYKFKEGDYLSINGSTGKVYAGVIETEEAQITSDFATIMSWADEIAKLKVYTNADNKRDTLRALELGAQGIGLVRTEHMFFETDRIKAVREMILATTSLEREKALNKVLPMQKKDFTEIFTALNGKPATIRFLDIPLHEFLPKEDEEIRALSKGLGKTFEELKNVVSSLSEFNPMMGFRGCRLSIVMPEIAVMQTRAVIEAAIEVQRKTGTAVNPEIMVPLIVDVKELLYMKDIIQKTADKIIADNKVNISYKIGTMVETPRAAITTEQFAKHVDFISFGTNDLTQMTFGFSRDDVGHFIGHYNNLHLLDYDPFARIDENGVGQLIEKCLRAARAVDKNFKAGICGEHGGEPNSIAFAHNVGITYVSCSPYRVPIARLSVAQAQIKNPK